MNGFISPILNGTLKILTLTQIHKKKPNTYFLVSEICNFWQKINIESKVISHMTFIKGKA